MTAESFVLAKHALPSAAPCAGDFDFAARLAKPLQPLAADDALAWLEQNPRGLILSFTRDWQPAPEAGFKLAYEVPYRLQAVRLWEAKPVEAVAPITPGTPPPGMR